MPKIVIHSKKHGQYMRKTPPKAYPAAFTQYKAKKRLLFFSPRDILPCKYGRSSVLAVIASCGAEREYERL